MEELSARMNAAASRSPGAVSQRDELTRSLTALSAALGLALLLYDLGGRLLRATESAAVLLRDDVEEDRVRAVARRLALAALQRGERLRGSFRTEIATLHGHYELRAARFPASLAECAAVVSLAVRAPVALTDGELRRRGGLTHREVEVARLMARGSSNAGIGESLGISHHTAERHAERILRKLRLSSRAAVAALLHPPA